MTPMYVARECANAVLIKYLPPFPAGAFTDVLDAMYHATRNVSFEMMWEAGVRNGVDRTIMLDLLVCFY